MPKEQEWYGKWLAEKGGMRKHLHIAKQLFLTLEHEPIRRIVEYFGGAGRQTQVLHRLFQPELHIVYDNRPDACAALRALGLPVDVYQKDFSVAVEHDAKPDLVVLDFPDLGWRGAQKRYHAPLAQVFSRATPYIIVTDTTGVRFSAQRKTTWAKLLNIAEPTFNDYLHGFSRWLFSEWGYAMRDRFHTGFEGSLRPGETMFTLQPGCVEPTIHAFSPAPLAQGVSKRSRRAGSKPSERETSR
jgi:hypothetical protein